MTFGDSAKLFELMEVEKKKIAGESVWQKKLTMYKQDITV
jgi:hypothetical protein